MGSGAEPAPFDATAIRARTRALLLEPARTPDLAVEGVTDQLGEALAAEDRQAEAWLRLLRGCLLEREGDLARAVADLVHAGQLFAAQGEVEGEILGAWRLGVAWARVGDTDNAARAHETGLTLARAHGHRLYEGILVFNLGFNHGAQNEPAQYRVLTEQALAIFTELGAGDRVALTLCNLAGALVGLGQLEEAEAAYDRAAPVAEASGLILAQGLIEGGRGELAFKRGLVAEGIRRTEAAAAWFQRNRMPYDAVRQTHLTARGLLANGAPERAIRVLSGAIQAAERQGFRSLVVQTGELLAEAYAAAGAHAEAYATLRAAWAQRSKILRAEAQQRFAMLRDAQEASAIARQTLQAQDLAIINRQLRESLANQQALRQVLEDQVRLDPLTQALNRRGLAEAVPQAQRWAQAAEAPLAVLAVDIDRFKQTNDTAGHAAGDRVLQHIADRLRAEVREGDLVARVGGDEFVVVLRGADDSRARRVAERIQAAVAAKPVSHGELQVPTSVSIGVALVAPDEPLEDALERADADLFAHKRAGTGPLRV